MLGRLDTAPLALRCQVAPAKPSTTLKGQVSRTCNCPTNSFGSALASSNLIINMYLDEYEYLPWESRSSPS